MKNNQTYECHHYLKVSNLKTAFLFLACFMPGLIFSQTQHGIVLSNETKSGIGFVNIGVVGKNIGTVSDKSGHFSIDLNKVPDEDSLRFSMIGYNSRSFQVGWFKQDSLKEVYLSTRVYTITEMKVVYRKPKRVELGSRVTTNDLSSGFGSNDLGYEVAVKAHNRNRVRLTDINLNVSVCTYDSVTYRLNIYQLVNNENVNILNQPIYLSFKKDRIKNAVSFDLSQYSIIVDGDFMIALELYRDLGEGKLMFHTAFFVGTTYHRNSTEGSWVEAPGVIGIYVRGVKID